MSRESNAARVCGGAGPIRLRIFAWFMARFGHKTDRYLAPYKSQLFADQPGGKLLFIEHVAAPTGTLLRRIQSAVKPLWRRMGDGCHPDRETRAAIERSGLTVARIDEFAAPLPVVCPHIAGHAIKPISPSDSRFTG